MKATTRHLYTHLIGTTVGIKVDGQIVSATVMTPDFGQDHHLITVQMADGWCITVRDVDIFGPEDSTDD